VVAASRHEQQHFDRRRGAFQVLAALVKRASTDRRGLGSPALGSARAPGQRDPRLWRIRGDAPDRARGVLGGRAGAMTVRGCRQSERPSIPTHGTVVRNEEEYSPATTSICPAVPRAQARLDHPTGLPVRLDPPGAAARSVSLSASVIRSPDATSTPSSQARASGS
jgi:hypothetical protein